MTSWDSERRYVIARLARARAALEDLCERAQRIDYDGPELGAIRHHLDCAAGLVRAAAQRFYTAQADACVAADDEHRPSG